MEDSRKKKMIPFEGFSEEHPKKSETIPDQVPDEVSKGNYEKFPNGVAREISEEILKGVGNPRVKFLRFLGFFFNP